MHLAGISAGVWLWEKWLPVQAAMDACGANAQCQGFQYCFLTPGTAGNAVGRIRLKGGSPGALNISEAIYNPYCRSASSSSSGFADRNAECMLS
jgi:hypothetical protein